MTKETLILELLAQWEDARTQGANPTPQELCPELGDLWTELEERIQKRKRIHAMLNPPVGGEPDRASTLPYSATKEHMPQVDPQSLPGFTKDGLPVDLVGDYEVLEVIGQGGMGIVYKARQRSLNRLVALKMVRNLAFAGPGDRDRFRWEAEAVARLQHPNIVQVFQVGEFQGHPFMVLELVGGGSLATRLASTPQPPREAAQVVETLALAMQVAHQQGIIHRDLKPANVLIADGGLQPGNASPCLQSTIKIADFGLAKLLEGEAGQSQTGIAGTPSYMAPEQASGRAREIGPTTDVYALGAILYEMLTGRPPFKGATAWETLEQLRSHEIIPPRQLQPSTPRDLETICLKALAREPGRRYLTASDLADDLRRWRSGLPIQARPVSHIEKVAKWAKRHPAVSGLLAGIVLVGLAGIVGIAIAYGEALRGWAQARKDRTTAEVKAKDARDAEQKAKDSEARAKMDRDFAQEQERLATRTLANSRYAIAEAAWQEHNAVGAIAHLDEVPADLRTWEWRYFKRYYAGSLWTGYGHTQEVYSVDFSPDGQTLASASKDHTVKLWDARTGLERATLKGHTAPVTCVGFSPDGHTLASGGEDGTVRLWNVQFALQRASLQCGYKYVQSLAFSPDGLTLASATFGGMVKLWDARTGQGRATLKRPLVFSSSPLSMAFSADGLVLAVAGDSKHAVELWDIQTGRPLATLLGHRMEVRTVAFSPDSLTLASGCLDGTLKLWDVRTTQERATLTGHSFGVTSVTFSPDGLTLASGSGDRKIKLWDVRTGMERATLRGHSGIIRRVVYSPDGQSLASAGGDRTVKRWDARTGMEETILKGHRDQAWTLAFSPDSQTLASGSQDGTVKLWDVRTGLVRATLPEHTTPVHSVAFSRDGQTLASGSDNGWVKLWDANTGRQRDIVGVRTNRITSLAFGPDVQTLAIATNKKVVQIWDLKQYQALGYSPPVATLEGHRQEIVSLAFSPDGKTLASGSHDRMVKLWDLRTGRERASLLGHGLSVQCLAFSPDGHTLASGSDDRWVKLWDVRTGLERATLRGHSAQVRGLAFSPDGQTLASGSEDKLVKLWDASTGQERATLKGQSDQVVSVAFSPDGQSLASGSGGGMVKVRYTFLGQERIALMGQSHWITSVAFSPDRQTLAGASTDFSVQLWDVRTGQERATLRGHANWIASVAFSADGQLLASASHDRTVKLWSASTGRERATLQGHKGEVVNVAFSRDGRRLRTQDKSDVVIVWDLETAKPLTGSFKITDFMSQDPPIDQQNRILALNDQNLIRLIKIDIDDDELAYRRWITRPFPDWHRFEAARCEKDQEWFAAAFHLEQLFQVGPPTPELLGRLSVAWAAAQARLPPK